MGDIRLDRFVTEDVVARLNAPVGRAEGLPPELYYDGEFWDIERRRLFGRGWIAAAFGSDVPAPGDVVPVSIAGWELIVARDADGTVRCFHNVCRHRGMRLVDKPCHRARAVACPWHSWTYNLKGELIATPNIGGMKRDEAEGIERATLGLRAVRCETWLNFVFVDIEGNAPPLWQHLAPLLERYRSHDFAALEVSDRRSEARLEGNWKLVIEGGLEDYHVPWVHTQFMPHPGHFKSEWTDGCFVGFLNLHPPELAFNRFQHDTTTGERIALPLFPHIDTTAPVESSLSLLFPNAYISVHPSHLMSSIIYPESPSTTSHRRTFLFVGDGATNPKYAGLRDETVASWMNLSGQDAPLVAATQRGLPVRAAAGIGTRYSPYWESGVVQFQRMVVQRLCG